MTKQLTTQNATITTVAVEVKTLTISGKQVTQSLFKQLQEEPVVAYDGTLNGTPWGYVNHCPERKIWNRNLGEWEPCAGRDHLHVVWQNGDQLRRARVAPPPRWYRQYWSEMTDAYVQAAYCANDHVLPEGMRSMCTSDGLWTDFEYGRTSCKSGPPESPRKEDHRCTGEQLDEARAELLADLRREHERRARRKAVWQALHDLPQLFIAV